MATRTISDAGGAWNTTGAWVEGAVPTQSDDVVATATSGNLSVTHTTAKCLNMDLTGYTGILSCTDSYSYFITVYGSLKLASGMTLTTTRFAFGATSGSYTIETFGKTISYFRTLSAATYTVLDDLTVTDTIAFTNATLNIEGLTVTCASLHSNFGGETNTLYMDGATIYTRAFWGAKTNYGKADLYMSANYSGYPYIAAKGSCTFGTVSMSSNYLFRISCSKNWILDDIVIDDLIINTTSGSPYAPEFLFASPGTLIINNSITQTSDGVRIFFYNNNYDESVTVVCNGSVHFEYADFYYIEGSGTADWDLSGIFGLSGDRGGNTGLSFSTAMNCFWVGGSGNSNDSAHWAASSGGTGGTARVPLPQDEIFIDANSFSAPGTITIMSYHFGGNGGNFSLDCPYVITLTRTSGLGSLYFYGSVNIQTSCTGTFFEEIYLLGCGIHTLDFTGNLDIDTAWVAVWSPTGSYSLLSDLNVGAFEIWYGSFISNGYSININNGGLLITNWSESSTTNVNFNGSIINLNGSSLENEYTDDVDSSKLIISYENTEIHFYDYIGAGGNFGGEIVVYGGKFNRFNKVYAHSAGSESGLVQDDFKEYSQMPYIEYLEIDPGIYFYNVGHYGGAIASPWEVGEFHATGTIGNIIQIVGGDYSKSSGRVFVDYVSLSSNDAVGGAIWKYGENSTIGSGVTGWSPEALQDDTPYTMTAAVNSVTIETETPVDIDVQGLALTQETATIESITLVEPDALALSGSVETPLIIEGADMQINPDALALIATLETAEAQFGHTNEPSEQSLSLSVETPAIFLGDGYPQDDPLTISLSIQTPTVVISYTNEPSELTITFTQQTETEITECTFSDSVQAATLTLQTPTYSQDVTYTPSELTLTSALTDAPLYATDATMTPTALSLSLNVETISYVIDQILTVQGFSIGTTIQAPVVALDATITPENLTLTMARKYSPVFIGQYADIGLRYKDDAIVPILVRNALITDKLRIQKEDRVYGVPLVDTSADEASNWRIKIASGTKAIQKASWPNMISWEDVTPADAYKVFRAVGCSSTGQYLVAGSTGGRLWTSANYGASWTERRPAGDFNKSWNCVCISADGKNIAAGMAFGRFYTSADYGATWTERAVLGALADRNYYSTRCDSSGSIIYVSSTYLYKSINGGATWVTAHSAAGGSGLATSASGSVVIRGCSPNNGYVYVSTNAGSTFTQYNPSGIPTSAIFSTVSCSTDGSIILAGYNTGSFGVGKMYKSTNYGANWTEIQPNGSSTFWASSCMSGNGVLQLYGATNPGGLYYSYDSGSTFREERPTGAGGYSYYSVVSTVSAGYFYVTTDNKIYRGLYAA